MPNALMEAMAAGLPVVATSVDGVPMLIDDGVNGFLTSFGDKKKFADRIVEIYNNPEISASLGINARKTMINSFSVEKMAQEYMDLYLKLLEGIEK
jgi:glycosyltransferase involved in cell wall biosynthesis